MKRSKFKILVLSMLVVLLTGCVKMDVTMEVKNDKSMNLSMIYAVSKELDEYSTSSDEEQIKEYENKGFYVEKYEEDGKTGYKITKQYKNIDEVSTEETLEKGDMTDALTGDKQYMFTVKKSFLKNTYTASYNFNTGSLGDINTLEEYDENCIYEANGYSCGMDVVEDQEANKKAYNEYIENQKAQVDEFTSSMDMKFNLKLPNKVKSSNATSVTNGGKNLVWDLSKSSDVSFEFELYNMTNVYIAIGIAAGVVFILFICIISMKKGGKNTHIASIDKDYKPNFLNDSIGPVPTDVNNTSTSYSNNSEQIVNTSDSYASSGQFANETVSTPDSSNSFIQNENYVSTNNDVSTNNNIVSNPSSAFEMPPMIDQNNTNIDNNNNNVN